MEGHIGDQPWRFIIRLYKPLCVHLCLPTPFAREMELEQLRVVRLHIRGCGNDSMWVDIDFPTPHVMYLRHGWNTFVRAHGFSEGHVLQFKFMESGLLSAKIFGRSGGCLGCCAESSIDDESSSSRGSDEEDSDGDDDGSGRQGDDSDSG
nr:B3 domain-containing protein Os03g0212300-like [Aegilops tauschii subsp. strangulata]